MEGTGFKITMSIFAVAIIVGLFFMVNSGILDKQVDESPPKNQKLLECYHAALDCKENENVCGECYNACKYFAKDKEVKKGAVSNCLTGNAEEIIEGEQEIITSNESSSNSTGNYSNSTTSYPEEPIQK